MSLSTVNEIKDHTIAHWLGALIEWHHQRYLALKAYDSELTKTPFLLGITGSVSVGKTYFARALQSALQVEDPALQISLLSTDNFIKPNAVLKSEGILDRKGFPESYDNALFEQTILALKSGEPVTLPTYSHAIYDIDATCLQPIEKPDLVIFEGLNIIQPWQGVEKNNHFFIDYLDYIIFLEADLKDIQHWFIKRFMQLREEAHQDSSSFYRQFLDLIPSAAEAFALKVWQDINLPNYLQYIEPYRYKADLILRKNATHAIQQMTMRKL